MGNLTLSIATPGDPLYRKICDFEAAFLKSYYDAYPILTNDVVVAIHEDGKILAAASYASGTTNNPLIPEVAAPDAFLQPDGTPYPRDKIGEYAGRMFDDAIVTSRALRLQMADVLSLCMYRIAKIHQLEILAGISGKSERAMYRRINLEARVYPVDRQKIEQHFNDRWDLYFSRERAVTNLLMREQVTDGSRELLDTISRISNLTNTSPATSVLISR